MAELAGNPETARRRRKQYTSGFKAMRKHTWSAIKVGMSQPYDSLSGAPLGVGRLGMSATVVTMMLDGLTKKFSFAPPEVFNHLGHRQSVEASFGIRIITCF